MISEAMRQELRTLEDGLERVSALGHAGILTEAEWLERGVRLLNRMWALLIECGAPMAIRLNEEGTHEVKIGPAFQSWFEAHVGPLDMEQDEEDEGDMPTKRLLARDAAEGGAERAVTRPTPRRTS